MYFFLLTIIVLFFIWCYVQKRKFRSLDRFPSPKSYPIIGSVLEFGFSPADILNTMLKISYNTPMATIWLGPIKCCLLSTDPDFMEFILSSPKHIAKSIVYDPFKPWLKNGLLLSNGSYWQKRRKILTPAFHFTILEGFVNIFNNQANILIDRLSKQIDKDPFDVHPFIIAYTLDVICETAMGTSVKAQSTIDNEYVKGIQTLCYIIVERVFSAWKQSDFLFKFSNSYKRQQNALNIVHSFSKSIIEQRRKNLILENKNKSEGSTDDLNIKKKQVFLDILLNATINGVPLSDSDIQEEVDTFMFEGHDTSATLLSFAMFELSRNPDVQNKMLQELQEILHDKNYQPTLQDLNNLKYTELVLKETMRLYPSVVGISRVMEEDVIFKGTIIPKDTILALFVFGMHRREDIFPNASKFIPERFLSKDFISNPFSYVPFSAGPRNCIGQRFAMYEAKSVISKIVLNYEILPAGSKYDPILSGEIILKSLNGIHVQLKHRKY